MLRIKGMVTGAICFILGISVGSVSMCILEKDDKPVTKMVSWEQKIPEPTKSDLKDEKKCYLCGDDNRSLMSLFRQYDDLGLISVNDWYVLDLGIRNHDDVGNLTGPQGHMRSAITSTGKDGCLFNIQQNSDRGIVKVETEYDRNPVFDVENVQSHLCQKCLDKVLEVMKVYGEENEPAEPIPLCLVDFQTLELYPVQDQNRSYYIRDYYVELENEKDVLKVMAVYAPILGRKVD